MLQVWKPDLLTKLYVFSLCLLVYAAADVSWLFAVPRSPLYVWVGVLSIMKALKTGVHSSPKKILWIFVWFVFNVIFIVFQESLISQLFRLLFFLIISSVILLSLDEMKYLLKILTNCFVLILIVSIPAWILYLTGVPMARTGPYYHEDGFHVYYDYFFFTTSIGSAGSMYSRFSSVFLEPGQMATPCVFLFHLNSKENKLFQFKNVIMLVAIIMSFSLIAYGLLLASLVVNRMSNNRNRMPVVIITLLFMVGLGWYFVSHENNVVNALIVSRLEYDEETIISGNNRTNDYFDSRYDDLIHSKDKYFGIHNQSLDWTINTSGYKKYIVKNGIVGFAIALFLMFILLLDNKKWVALMYCIMVIVAFLVRDMLTTPLWLACAIIGMYILGSDSKEEEYSNLAVIENN